MAYSLPVSFVGTTLEAAVYKGISRPQWGLQALDVNSRAQGYELTLNQNLHTSRATSADAHLRWNHHEADTTSTGNTLTEDELNVLRLGAVITHADRYQGLNQAGLVLSHGMSGGTEAGSRFASRIRGTAVGFTKINANASRLQRLNENWALLLAAQGQFSSHALLATEEFGCGGEGWCRGYENNEIIGDHGAAAKSELQLTFNPDFWWLDSYQLFGFADFGATWNKDRDPTEASTATTRFTNGLGTRFSFSPAWSAEATLARPISHNTATGGDKNPTLLVRLKHRFMAQPKPVDQPDAP